VNNLKGKKLLFIAPVFYNYHELIIKKMEEKGAEVYFIPERKYNFVFTFVNNFLQNKLDSYQYAHYFSFLDKIENTEFDYLFVIRGFKMPKEFIDAIKAMNPKIKTVMYQWDSSINNSFLHLLDSFDLVNSFDYTDCENYPKLNYIPLFYSDDIEATVDQTVKPNYDVFLFGVYMPARYKAAKQLKTYCEQNNITYYFYIYIPLRTYIKEKFLGRKLDMSFLHIKFLKRSQYIQILQNSNVIVDISSPSQSGLAMRIIESLACKKKIVTTNTRLLSDPSITANQVRYLDLENIEFPYEFIHEKVSSKMESILSLGQWVDKNFEKLV
jgi:hypothetical protein